VVMVSMTAVSMGVGGARNRVILCAWSSSCMAERSSDTLASSGAMGDGWCRPPANKRR
jgi:hypothetical protein